MEVVAKDNHIMMVDLSIMDRFKWLGLRRTKWSFESAMSIFFCVFHMRSMSSEAGTMVFELRNCVQIAITFFMVNFPFI
jgi:hypothetical protein